MCVRAGSGDSVCVRVCVCVCVCVRACVRAHAKCLCDFVTVEFVVTESSTGPRKRFRERTRNSKEFRIEESRGNLAMTSDVGGGHLPESL